MRKVSGFPGKAEYRDHLGGEPRVSGPGIQEGPHPCGAPLHRHDAGYRFFRTGDDGSRASSATARPAKKAAKPAERPSPAKPQPAAAPAEEGEAPAEKARQLLSGLLSRMQIESPVTVEETEQMIILNIQGDGSGLLIGKRGQNLDALQYILNKAIHHSANGHKMIVIDTEGYRKRREEALVALALRIGEKVKKTKKPVTVGHMNAHDRRIIHLAVQNDENLATRSRGEGEYRKILILPARHAPDPSGN